MKLFLGIDTGTNTGFSVWNGKNFVELITIDFWKCIEKIEYYYNICKEKDINLVIVVEDVTQNNPVFKIEDMYRKTKGLHVNKLKACCKKGVNVGKVQRETSLLIEYIENKNIKLIKKRPTKYSLTKIDSKAFEKFTGYNKRTSEHARDAAMLVFGM